MPKARSFAMVLLVLAGCAGPRPDAPADVLLLRTTSGVALLRHTGQVEALNLTGAVPSTDGSAVVRALPGEKGTRIMALDGSTAAQLWARKIPDRLEVKVVSSQGRMAALGKPLPRKNSGYPRGRDHTTLTLVGQGLSHPRKVTLVGNYEPEAFSTDEQSLFVIQYLPPQAPTRYRVRRLDLRTERVEGVYTVDAELQEAMQGTARVQAASPDGTRLYTLYMLEGDDGIRRAFVHVLSLDELWAHCVDLPAGFGESSEDAIALSVAPDGKRLDIADVSTGALAEIDTEALRVTRTSRVRLGAPGTSAHAARTSDGRLYVGSGTSLISVDISSFETRRSWDLADRITGIQGANDGSRVYVGLPDRVAILDAITGERQDLDLAGLGGIEQLGRQLPPLDEARTDLTCAC